MFGNSSKGSAAKIGCTPQIKRCRLSMIMKAANVIKSCRTSSRPYSGRSRKRSMKTPTKTSRGEAAANDADHDGRSHQRRIGEPRRQWRNRDAERRGEIGAKGIQ